MQTTNAAYQAIIASGSYSVEYKAVIGSATYDQTEMTQAPEISVACFDQFAIGQAVAGQLDLYIRPKATAIPSMSAINMYFRVKNSSSTSDWFPKGVFYIDTRQTDKNGTMHIVAYDKMLMTDYTYMESGTWQSTTALSVLQDIASDIDCSIESGTSTYMTNNPQTVPSIPVIGSNGTTAREMLQNIATMYGGNFIFDESGNIKLVKLTSPATTLNIGVLATDLDQSPAFSSIDRVIINSGFGDGVGYRSPNVTDAQWEAMTGRILSGTCAWTSQAIADAVRTIVNGFTYKPIKASGATVDPAVQLGDGITCNGVTGQIFKEHIVLDSRCAADLEAPYDEEVNHEYPYRSAAQRQLDSKVSTEELKTAGSVSINGSNIHAGTITLGGNNNENGQVIVKNASDVQIGEWNKDGIELKTSTIGPHTKNYYPLTKSSGSYELPILLLSYTYFGDLTDIKNLVGDQTLTDATILNYYDFNKDGEITDADCIILLNQLTEIENSGYESTSSSYEFINRVVINPTSELSVNKQIVCTDASDDVVGTITSDSIKITPNSIMLDGNSADLVIAEGSSGNWYYRKWNNGDLECWTSESLTISSWSAWGGLYNSTEKIGPLTFPVAFTGVPIIQISAYSSQGSVLVESEGNAPTSTQTGVYGVSRGTTGGTWLTSATIEIYAKGRWE